LPGHGTELVPLCYAECVEDTAEFAPCNVHRSPASSALGLTSHLLELQLQCNLQRTVQLATLRRSRCRPVFSPLSCVSLGRRSFMLVWIQSQTSRTRECWPAHNMAASPNSKNQNRRKMLEPRLRARARSSPVRCCDVEHLPHHPSCHLEYVYSNLLGHSQQSALQLHQTEKQGTTACGDAA
jgi:hypothetical protein